jgi:hypothetical protein
VPVSGRVAAAPSGALPAAVAAVLVAAIAGAASGCGERRAVAPAPWAETWDRLRPELPDPAALASGEPPAPCEAALAALRAGEVALERAPSTTTEDAFDRWRVFALELYYECPLRGGAHAGWAAGAQRLHELEVAVERSLAAPR